MTGGVRQISTRLRSSIGCWIRIAAVFRIEPAGDYRTERAYRPDSNVLETRFITDSGSVRLTESVNSTLAGRLPWSELARRVEAIDGEVELRLTLRFGTREETRSPRLRRTEQGDVYHLADLMMMLRIDPQWEIEQQDDRMLRARLKICAGNRAWPRCWLLKESR